MELEYSSVLNYNDGLRLNYYCRIKRFTFLDVFFKIGFGDERYRMLKFVSNVLMSLCSRQIAYSQPKDTAQYQPVVMAGLVITPLLLFLGYSVSTSYGIKLGFKNKPIFFTFKGGIASCNRIIEGDFPVTYSISGNFIQPGISFFYHQVSKKRVSQFFNFSAYLGKYNHAMSMGVTDIN